jgi:glycosyltransferase involved in cell wall biosynthesis
MSVLNRATVAIAPNQRVPQHIIGLPTKLFEYMAAGLPIVASDLPPAIEFVGGSQAGLLAQPENPASFADSIDKLINDRLYARSLGQNGQRAFREKFSWESQMPDLAKFYERILCPAHERR